MIVSLANIQLFIGANEDTEQALNLSLLPSETNFYNLENGQKVIASFCSLKETHNKTERCIDLIKQVLKKLPQQEQDELSETVVFLLLPVFEQTQNDEKSAEFNCFVQALSKEFPQLFNQELSQCFPFGSAAFLIALKSVIALFSNKKVSKIVLLAVDSLYDKMGELASGNKLKSTEQAGCMVPSEGAAFCQIIPSAEGLSIDCSLQGIVPEKQIKQGINNLFAQASSSLVKQSNKTEQSDKKVKITSLYLPGNGDESQQPWLDAYFYLADNVSIDTKIYQNTLFTGELGCVTGLYNFLHIYNGYQNEWLTGISGHLEVSEALYQGFSLYSWTGTA